MIYSKHRKIWEGDWRQNARIWVKLVNGEWWEARFEGCTVEEQTNLVIWASWVNFSLRLLWCHTIGRLRVLHVLHKVPYWLFLNHTVQQIIVDITETLHYMLMEYIREVTSSRHHFRSIYHLCNPTFLIKCKYVSDFSSFFLLSVEISYPLLWIYPAMMLTRLWMCSDILNNHVHIFNGNFTDVNISREWSLTKIQNIGSKIRDWVLKRDGIRYFNRHSAVPYMSSPTCCIQILN